MLLGNLLCLRSQKEKGLGLLPEQSRLCIVLPGSALHSQTAHFPFSTTYWDKSEVTLLIDLVLTSRIEAPYLVLVSAMSVCMCVSC